jgi:hypothetical protein
VWQGRETPFEVIKQGIHSFTGHMGINCPYGNLEMDMRANPNPQISSCKKTCNRSAHLPGDPCLLVVCVGFLISISLMEIPVLFSGASGKLSGAQGIP